ncbi:cytochrome c, partial [Cribrihabitans sp. XS_ASV171]
MKLWKFAIAGAIMGLGTVALAQDVGKQVKARQGQMQIVAMNLGVLGGIAKGEIAYDAETAQRAADSLVGISMIDQGPLWVEGSDTMSIDGTRALPAIWDNNAEFMEHWKAYVAAAAAMSEAAGQGQEAIGAAMRD